MRKMSTTTSAPRVLIVDDEEPIRFVLRLNLEGAGYRVEEAASAEQALAMKPETFDLILLDVMMGDMDGFECARRIRQNKETAEVPIIFCTAKDTEADLLAGFDRGADDYIRKPFSMKELIARVRSVLQRTARAPRVAKLIIDDLEIDLQAKQCTLHGEPVQLTKTEFEVLAFLIKSEGKIWPREEILENVWPEDVYVVDRTIDVNINRLRKKLGEYGKYIITKQGYGYGFETNH